MGPEQTVGFTFLKSYGISSAVEGSNLTVEQGRGFFFFFQVKKRELVTSSFPLTRAASSSSSQVELKDGGGGRGTYFVPLLYQVR